MVRKLKWKFIGIATGSLLLVLLVVLGLVNAIVMGEMRHEAYDILNFIHEYHTIPDNQGKLSENDLTITPETRYETRYFILTVKDGEIESFNSDHIAAVSRADLDDFVNQTKDKKNGMGFFSWEHQNYAYLKCPGTGESEELIFLDYTNRMAAVRTVTKMSAYVGAASMALLFILLSVFSRKAIQPILRNMQAQKQFITNASHELKTPLAVISANTEVIEMMDGKNEWTESTKRQVTRMSELVSQLVVLSKLEEREDLVLEKVDFSAQAEEVTETFHPVAETQGKVLKSEIQKGVTIQADEKGSRELISILLDNAVKYCDEKGMISLKLFTKGKQAILQVSNDYKDGGNVDYSRFFERFYREDQSHNHEKAGFGIGLSMADSLVGMFHGKITASWKDGRIQFQVTLQQE